MGEPHTTYEGWVEDGRTMLHVRGGEGMGGGVGAVYVISPWYLFLQVLPDALDLARSKRQSSCDK